jgi:hypothetical protein
MSVNCHFDETKTITTFNFHSYTAKFWIQVLGAYSEQLLISESLSAAQESRLPLQAASQD